MIGILAGHNKVAVGSYSNELEEYYVNEKIADNIAFYLGEKAKRIYRGEDLEAYTKLPNLLNNENIKLAVEIHCGADDNCKSPTCEAVCKADDYFSIKLCKAINQITFKTTGIDIKEVVQVGQTGRGSYLINNTKCKTIIIKPFFLHSKKDYTRIMENLDRYSMNVASLLEQALEKLEKGGE